MNVEWFQGYIKWKKAKYKQTPTPTTTPTLKLVCKKEEIRKHA